MLVLLKFLCQISVDVKSLMTSFNILELRSKLLGFNILDMNHGPTVLQFLSNLLYLKVFLLRLGYFPLLGPEFFMKYFLVKYDFLKVHLKLLDDTTLDPGDTPAKAKTSSVADRCSISPCVIQSFRRNVCLTQHGDNSLSGR